MCKRTLVLCLKTLLLASAAGLSTIGCMTEEPSNGASQGNASTAPNSGGGATAPSTVMTSSPTEVPARLVGEWSDGASIPSNYYNVTTGTWGPGSGAGTVYRFTAGGNYSEAWLVQTSVNLCYISYFRYEEGTFVVDGDRLTSKPSRSREKSENNCGTAFNYDRDVEPSPWTRTWRVEDENGSARLTLRGQDGKDHKYSRR